MKRAFVLLLVGAALPPVGPAHAHHGRCRETPRFQVVGTPGDDVLVGTSGNDAITAGSGDDTIFGLAGNDIICGGGGDDDLRGGDENDSLWGGIGSDTVRGGAGADHIFSDPGDDALHGDLGPDRLGIVRAPGPVEVDLEAGTVTGQGNDTIENVEDVFGWHTGGSLTGDDTANELTAVGPADVVSGRGGDDAIGSFDSGGPDTLSGGSGDDEVVAGGTGTDMVFGGPGDDELSGFGGNETFDAGEDDDLILANNGSADVEGGPGDDVLDLRFIRKPVTVDLSGGTLSGAVTGSVAGIEHLLGTRRNDELGGDALDNQIDGRRAGDKVEGGAGNDVLAGNGGSDDLFGGEGDDVLDGGRGRNDRLFGGAGWDTCRAGGAGCETTYLVGRAGGSSPLELRLAQVSLGETDGERVIHVRFAAHERFATSDVAVITFSFLGPEDRSRSLVIFDPRKGGLKGRVQKANGKNLAAVDVKRPSTRSVVAALPVDLLPPDVVDDYFWDLSVVADAPECDGPLTPSDVCRQITPLIRASMAP